MYTGADTSPAAMNGEEIPDLAARIDELLSRGLGAARLPPDIAHMYRTVMRPTGRRTTFIWFVLAAGLNFSNIFFDFWMIPRHLLGIDVVFRVILSLGFAAAALLSQQDRLIRFEPLIAVTPCVAMVLLAGTDGMMSGDPVLLERLTNDAMVVVLSATIFLFIEIEYSCFLAAVSLLILAGFIGASDIRLVAVKAQIVYFYAGAEAALLYGRQMLNLYRIRLFLLNTRDELRNAEALRDNAILSREAFTDPLTGVANRRAFDEAVRSLVDSRRNLRPLSLCMIDVDNFKQLNDSAGHIEGDQALRSVANAITGEMRGKTDLLARFGGDEFLLLLGDTGSDEALVIAERIRALVEVTEQGRGITLSIGVAAVMGRQMTIEALLAEADAALYRAKQAGRNRASL